MHFSLQTVLVLRGIDYSCRTCLLNHSSAVSCLNRRVIYFTTKSLNHWAKLTRERKLKLFHFTCFRVWWIGVHYKLFVRPYAHALIFWLYTLWDIYWWFKFVSENKISLIYTIPHSNSWVSAGVHIFAKKKLF